MTMTGATGALAAGASAAAGPVWRIQHSANATLPGGQLESVSCSSASACTAVGNDRNPAANFCEAVGSYQLGNVAVALAEAWNGRGWTMQRFPVPVGDNSVGLNQVSCTSAQFCAAVGFGSGSAGNVTLAATWNGTSWHLHHT